MQTLLLIAFVLLINCCVKKETEELKPTPSVEVSKVVSKKTSTPLFYKDEAFLKAVYMAGSVEKEIFKVVNYNKKDKEKQYFQLEILSYALRYIIDPKTVPEKVQLQCKVYQLKQDNLKKVHVYKSCEQPIKLLATLTQLSTDIYDIEFNQSEWGDVIGAVAHILNKPRRCQLSLSPTKTLKSLNCLETVYASDYTTGIEDVRFEQFKYQSDGDLRVRVVGGKYKDMTRRSSIDIKIPHIGKIQFNEKELEFKDDFQEMIDEAAKTDVSNSKR